MQRRVPQQTAAEQVNEIARQHQFGAERQVGIGEISAKQLVVVLDARAEEQRPVSVQPQAETRQISRAFVIKALLAGAERGNVA